MNLNFMQFEDKNTLQKSLESYLRIGSSTFEDVFLFARNNNLQCSELRKNGPNDPERFRKHEVTIRCSAPAPTGARKFLSNWRNLFRAWQVLFYSAIWLIEFHFDDQTLSEIYVDIVYTSL